MAIIDIPVSPPRSTRAKVRAAAVSAAAGAAVLFVVAGVPAGHRINAEGAAEKTSLLQWAAAGGETAFRFTTLSAKTGAEMFFSPVRRDRSAQIGHNGARQRHPRECYLSREFFPHSPPLFHPPCHPISVAGLFV
eukprot:scaffold18488_cov88-Isochrysis_galbana.AAC.1